MLVRCMLVCCSILVRCILVLHVGVLHFGVLHVGVLDFGGLLVGALRCRLCVVGWDRFGLVVEGVVFHVCDFAVVVDLVCLDFRLWVAY